MFGGRSCQCRQNPQFLFPIPPHLNPRPHPSCRDWRTLHPAPPLSLSKFSDLVSRSADAIPSAANLEATFAAHSPHHLSRRANLHAAALVAPLPIISLRRAFALGGC